MQGPLSLPSLELYCYCTASDGKLGWGLRTLCACTSSDLNILIALQNMWTVRYTLGTYFMVYSEADEMSWARKDRVNLAFTSIGFPTALS